MNWQNFFDKIFVINLHKRPKRLERTTKELNAYGIKFQPIAAIENENGAKGLFDTMRWLFSVCLAEGMTKILVFEDDCKIIGAFNSVMEDVITQLPEGWLQLYLGCNPVFPFKEQVSQNIIRLGAAYTTHAVCYSKEAMQLILNIPEDDPLDVTIAKTIHNLGRSYCTYPLLVSQYPEQSDIFKFEPGVTQGLDEYYNPATKEISWGSYLEKEFDNKYKMLKQPV